MTTVSGHSGWQSAGDAYGYDMTFDWADLTAVPEAVNSWAHNGIVVTGASELIGFHAGLLVTFDRSGNVSRSARPGLTEGHGITLVREGDDEFLWVSDPGFVFEVGPDDGLHGLMIAGRDRAGHPAGYGASAAPARVASDVRSAPRLSRCPCQFVLRCSLWPTDTGSTARSSWPGCRHCRRRTMTTTIPVITSSAISPAMT